MYCPQCGGEFRPGFARCKTCNADLVERDEPAEPETSTKSVDWARYLVIGALIQAVFAFIPGLSWIERVLTAAALGVGGSLVYDLVSSWRPWRRERESS